jgi:hypothetical protein
LEVSFGGWSFLSETRTVSFVSGTGEVSLFSETRVVFLEGGSDEGSFSLMEF